MIDTTLQLTFRDMVLRVAEYLGLASNTSSTASVPTDAHDLDLCKRLVNDGYRRFCNERGGEWHWQRPTFSITLDPDGLSADNVKAAQYPSPFPDAARYFMPLGFAGRMFGWFTYGSDAPYRAITEFSEQQMREVYSGTNSTTGDPTHACITPLQSPAQPARQSPRWQVVFWPTPGTAYIVTARCAIYPYRLQDMDDTHAAGFIHDDAILMAALAQSEFYTNNKRGEMEANYLAALQRSIAFDSRSVTRNLGYNGCADGAMSRGRLYTGVDTYNGNPV